jgi:DNA-directed RNA polymerase specialized sigma24 family protein
MAHSGFHSEQDFADAYDTYADAIFRHCYLRTLSRAKAKDVLLESYQRLWQFIAEGNYVDSMKLFLYRAAHKVLEAQQLEGMGVPELQTVDNELHLLQQLPSEDRCVLVLHYVDGFSPAEIGTILGGVPNEHAAILSKGKALLSSLLVHG